MWSSRRFLALSATALLLSASAVACGPSSQPAPAPAPPREQPAASAPAPSAPAAASVPGPGGVAATGAGSVPGPGGEGTPKRGGKLVITQVEDPPCWDVHCTSFSRLTHHTWKTHNRLLRYDYNGKPGSLVVVGDLAEKWDASADGKTWTITLRKGVKFHNLPPVNGRELTAEDVKFSWDRIMTGDTSIWKGRFQEFIDKVEVVDKYAVRFTLKYAYASFIYRLAEGECCWMVAKEVVSQPEYGKDPKKSLIGTGPFLFDQYERGVFASEKRNPNYFGLDWPGQVPYLDATETLIMPDAAARLAAFATKQIDITSVPRAELDKVKAIPGVQFRPGAGAASSNGLSINTTRAPFDNVKVRQALKYGVSQQTVLDGLFRGDGEWHGVMGNKGTAWALPDAEVRQLYKYDPELSKKLLAEAGYPSGLKAEVIIASNDQSTINIFEVWKADLQKAGFDLTPKIDSVASVRKAAEDGNYSLYMGPHSTAIEPDEVISDGFIPSGSRNFSRLNDPIVNDLAKKQTVITNNAERKKVTDEIQRRLAEIVPLIPWPAQNTYTAAQGYLKNWFPGSGQDDCNEQFYWFDGK